jgi:hypothetical protein
MWVVNEERKSTTQWPGRFVTAALLSCELFLSYGKYIAAYYAVATINVTEFAEVML